MKKTHLLFFIITLSCAWSSVHGSVVVVAYQDDRHPVTGTFVASDEEFLALAPFSFTPHQRLMIPLSAVRSISWSPVDSREAEPYVGLSRTKPLWHHFDRGSMEKLIVAIEAVAATGDWQSAYHHLEQLLSLTHPPEREQRLRVLKAWFLYELGLFSLARVEVDQLTQTIPLLKASLRLCWVGAKLAVRANDPVAAERWAALPFLQIPAAQGPLADELLNIALSTPSLPSPPRP